IRRSVSVSSCVRSAIELAWRPPAPSLTGNRPARSVTLSTSFPCASVRSNAWMRRRLGPRVGVSSTRYAFRLPRSATMMREVGVISELLTNAARAGKAAHHVSYNWIRCSRQGCAAKEISTRDALEPRTTSTQVTTDSAQARIFPYLRALYPLCEFIVLGFFRPGGFFFDADHCRKIDMSLLP